MALSGCGADPANSIDGSLTASYDMDFDEVRVQRFTTEVSVSYVRSPGPGEEIVLKLAVSHVETDIHTGQAIDFHPPTGSEPTRSTTDGAQFPDLCDDRPSTLTFSEYGEHEGDSMEGEWRLCFDTGDGGALDGVGTFSADLEVID